MPSATRFSAIKNRITTSFTKTLRNMNSKYIFIAFICFLSFSNAKAQTPILFEAQVLKNGKPFNLETDYLTPADSLSIIEILPVPTSFLLEKLPLEGVKWKFSGTASVNYAVGRRAVLTKRLNANSIQLNPTLLADSISDAKKKGTKEEDLNARIIVTVSQLEGKMPEGEKKIFKNEEWITLKVRL